MDSLLRTNEELVIVYNRHVKLIYKICFMYMKNVFETENMVQDTFLKLIEKSPNFENLEHEKAWLIRTAVNLCKNSLKHWWRQTVDIDSQSEAAIEQSFNNDEILEKIKALPSKYKSVIFLYYYEGYSTAEISKILNIKESTLRGHLCRARMLLKIELEFDMEVINNE